MAGWMHLVIIALYSIPFGSCQQEVSSKFSVESGLCDVTERVDRGCSSQISNTKSLVQCVSRCGYDTSCVGASLDPNGLCFHHKECPVLSGCTIKNDEHRFMKKYCVHGTWDMTTQSCQCVEGFFGDRCKKHHKTCRDLVDWNYSTGFHRIYIDPDHNGLKPFRVLCYIQPHRSETFVLRNRGQKNFNRTWIEYVNGFYDDNDHLWIGLHALKRLANLISHSILRVHFLSRSACCDFLERHYTGLSVSGESTGYRLTFTSSWNNSSGDALSASFFSSCLELQQNVPFSTWDADHDGKLSENCAAVSGSGWWYKGCDNSCNALGWGLKQLISVPTGLVKFLIGVDLDINSTEEIFFKFFILD